MATRLGPEEPGEELEEWLRKRADDLELYRETMAKQEYDITLERIEETVEKLLEE